MALARLELPRGLAVRPSVCLCPFPGGSTRLIVMLGLSTVFESFYQPLTHFCALNLCKYQPPFSAWFS